MNIRNESLGGDGEGVLIHLGTGCDPGLHAERGIEFGSELLILLMQGGSIVTIVSVHKRNRLYSQRLDKESEPHGTLAGCGGSSSGQQSDPITSSVTVTATSGNLQHTVTITLQVP
jgi:hypothetical protein